MSNSEAHPFSARDPCRCGAVTFTVAGPPIRMAQCHCTDCQCVTGTGHSTNAIFRKADVTVQGDTTDYSVTADSGNTVTRHFCPTCGSRVFALNSGGPEFINLPAGAFDDSTWFKPQLAVFVKQRRI